MGRHDPSAQLNTSRPRIQSIITGHGGKVGGDAADGQTVCLLRPREHQPNLYLNQPRHDCPRSHQVSYK